MIFPKWLEKGDGIGVVAPSAGVTKPLDIVRFENAKEQLAAEGYPVTIAEHVFCDDGKGRSSDGVTRGKDLNGLFADNSIRAIISAKGGDFLVEMLPHCDFKVLIKNPKWVQGYSDNTSLLYYITTKLDIATVYGFHFGDFGMKLWHEAVSNGLHLLEGKNPQQNSFSYYEDGFYDRETGLEGFHEDKPVCWVNGRGEEKISVSGRLIGGCLDVLGFICGTKYDGTLEFIEKYKEDGILWYLESFHAFSEELIMKLWQLKELGWFAHASGFLFGRPCMYESFSGTSYQSAVMSILGDLNVPVIFDMDIGHKGPQFSMINGAKAEVVSENGKGSLKYI